MADSAVYRPAPRRAALRGPAFDQAVPPGGYLWWYLDAQSDDGRHALTVIAFVGSVFSPYYAWSGRRDPLNHCAINVALYGQRPRRWAMTERKRSAVSASPDAFQVGASSVAWQGDSLVITVRERGAPVPRAIRGTIRVHPVLCPQSVFDLDTARRHQWQPIAPVARVTVAFSEPALSWQGAGYLDANWANESLEAGFADWTWSRAHTESGATVLYETRERGGGRAEMALRFRPDGGIESEALPTSHGLPGTLWRVPRRVRADAGASPKLLETLEDAPFYNRSRVGARLFGEPVEAFHESLDLDRFAAPWVRVLLPFRMPRL